MENPFKPSSNIHPWNNTHRHLSEYHHEGNKSSYATNNSAQTLSEGPDLSKEPSTPEEKDPRDSLIEDLSQSIKIKNIVNQTLPVSQASAPDLTPLLMSSMLSRNSFDPNIFLNLAAIIENKNVGFRGNVCINCFTNWIDPVYSNEGEMKTLLYTKSSLHTCDPKKVTETQKVQDSGIKKNELENRLVILLLSLTYLCATFMTKKPYLETKELIYPPDYGIDLQRNQSINYLHDNMNQELYLKCWVEGEELNCNPVNIGLATVDEKHWAYRAIGECMKSGESSFELNINELMDFLKASKGTLGVLTTDISESIRHFLMYISFR